MFVALSVLAVVIWVTAAADIVAVFTDDPAVVPIGAEFLKTVAPTFGFTGVMRAYSGGFRGAGKTLTAAAIAIFVQGVVRLPMAWLGADVFGVEGFFAAFVVSNITGAVVAYAWFRRGTWRGVDLTDDSTAGVSETVVEDDPAVDD